MAKATMSSPLQGAACRFSADGSIFPGDGCQVPGPTAVRDCLRQSAVDIMALVQNIKATDLGVQLDPTRVFLVGQSLGSFVGSLVHAVEPGIKAAVINVGGDSTVDTARLAYGDDSDLLVPASLQSDAARHTGARGGQSHRSTSTIRIAIGCHRRRRRGLPIFSAPSRWPTG